ncbi:hypothetical protein FG379_003661 [Cryptosporidium bovis]|uniref:uncharacterized protein n=1 Tax=Cryptosporidium bovis TaxID=310047 RepID=UPI00351A77CF|nr:hypothetical protein FG379_003661 [Cryptosporidium bovis]
MPILKKELKVNQELDLKSFLFENNYDGIVTDELNNSLKRIECVLIDLLKDINSLDLNYYDINKITNKQECDVGIEKENLDKMKMKILQGQNANLVDNIKLILSVVLRMFSEIDNMKDKIKVLINDSVKLRDENAELRKTVNTLNNDMSKLMCEKYHIEENLKVKTINCSKYKNSLNNSIKTMKRLYLENDYMNKEISILENQLVISKLRVAQHNEELEHIRILLKYYKNQVSQDYLLSPAIEQMVKVEPCRVSLNCGRMSNTNKNYNSNNKKNRELNSIKGNTTTGIKVQTNIGSILSKLLFNNGFNTSTGNKENINFSIDEDKKATKSTSPLYKYSPLNNNNISTPRNNYFNIEADETLLSTSADNIDIVKEDDCYDENSSPQLYIDDDDTVSPFSPYKLLKEL